MNFSHGNLFYKVASLPEKWGISMKDEIIEWFDDTVDIGEKPMEIEDEATQQMVNEFIRKYTQN